MICYKILQNRSGKLLSFNTPFFGGFYIGKTYLQYFLNVTVYPKIDNSGLFVFSTLADAEQFLSYRISRGYFEIWKCECSEISPFNGIMSDEKNIEKFWENQSDYTNVSRYDLPNSFITPHLTLIQKVQ